MQNFETKKKTWQHPDAKQNMTNWIMFRTTEHFDFEILPDKLERCHYHPHRDTQLEIQF